MLARQSGPVLDEIAGILRRCDASERFEIVAAGNVQASELVDFLVSAGVPRARLAAISYSRPGGEGANQDADAETAAAQPVDIRVLERSGE